jgi:hypothetical protein
LLALGAVAALAVACLVGMVVQGVVMDEGGVVTATAVPVDTATDVPEPTAIPSSTDTATPEPTKTPEPTATDTPVPTPTADLGAYSDELEDVLTGLADGMGRVGELAYEADFYDQGWHDDMMAAIGDVQASYERLEAMEPPPAMAEVHGTIVWAARDCYDAMPYLARGVEDLDADQVQRATQLMQSCNAKMEIANEQIDSLTNP